MLNLLHLEDDPADALLIAETIRRDGFEVAIVVCDSRASFVRALESGPVDVILADNRLPGFDGEAALALARAARPDTPFLFVSGFLGEETALELLKNGATDYVFKHNLARLAPALRRAVQEAEGRRVRREAERALRESEATLRSFFEASPVLMGILELDPDGRDLQLISFNHAVEDFLGVTGAPRPSRASVLGIPPEAIRAWRDAIERTDATGLPVRFEDPFHPSGRPRFLSATIARLPPGPGRPTRYCFVAEDTTVRRQMEQQALRSQRLESIGTLASGIAHDLNNVLAPVTLALRLFRPKLPDPDDRELIDSVGASVKRGASIIRQLLAFARGAEGERRPVGWDRLLADLERMLQDTFPRSIELRVVAAHDTDPVMGDATQIFQVLMNLCVNARDAMPAGGTLTVTVENAVLPNEQRGLVPDAADGRVVSVRVRDSGTGIPEAIQARIFDPFFTTKEVGSGTGLGLATALHIVRGHGGFIALEPIPGPGTQFHVCLPAMPERSAFQVPDPAGPSPAPAAVPVGAGQCILVVDDERSIRSVAHATLVDHGYQVLAAADGREALEVFSREGDRIHLVVTDLMMPSMDGATLIDRIRALQPGMRFVAVSGLLEESTAGHAGVRLLQKPFAAEALLRIIHEALHDAPR
jgi:PAS domain S-box-containing protein